MTSAIRDHAIREHSLALINTRALEYTAFYSRRTAAIASGDLEDIIQAERALQDRWKDLLDATTAHPKEAEPQPVRELCGAIHAPSGDTCEHWKGHAGKHEKSFMGALGRAWDNPDAPDRKTATPKYCGHQIDEWKPACELPPGHVGFHKWGGVRWGDGGGFVDHDRPRPACRATGPGGLICDERPGHGCRHAQKKENGFLGLISWPLDWTDSPVRVSPPPPHDAPGVPGFPPERRKG